MNADGKVGAGIYGSPAQGSKSEKTWKGMDRNHLDGRMEMDKKKQIEVLKYFFGRIYRSNKHKSQLDARIRGIKAKRQIEGCPAGEDPASIRYWTSDIEDRILEQKREIDMAIVQVMDILDYLPIHSVERQICELRHIDLKTWGAISAEIPMSRSQVYRRYRMALETILENQRVQDVMKEYEGEYDKYTRR